MKDKFDLYVGRKIPEQNTQEQCMNEYYPPELLKKWNEASLSDNFIFCKVMSENLGKHWINPIEDFSVLTLNAANCP